MPCRIRHLVATAVIALLAAPAPSGAADSQALRLDLRDPRWELAGDGTVVEELDGEVALRLKTGSATWRELEFLDGTIELDLQLTPYRSFSFISFRIEDEGEHEEIYFRAHKSRLPDAIQYTPVYKGSSQWQLYHDARSTAPAPLPPGEWIPIKVVVRGSQAAVFVGAAEEPRLVVPRLAREPRPGHIALKSFLPLGTPADVYITSFANLVVRPGVVDYEFPEAEPPAPVAGRIASWEISPAFVPGQGPTTDLAATAAAAGAWRTVPANADGVVELERWVDRPAGARRAGVLARHRILVDEATTGRLDLGFSDEASVFLNGRLLVADDESYSFNLPRRQGLLTASQLSVFLPLAAGANEVVVAVVDRFGGWGLSGRLELGADAARSPKATAAPAAGPPAAGTEQAAAVQETAAAVAAGGSAGRSVAELAWLAGCWQGAAGEECWLAPRGGMMIAVNRTPGRAGKLPFFELLRIVEDAAGLVFLAQPAGRSPAVPFPAVEVGHQRVVFANPEHDFPQRLTYWREGATLRVRVEAQRDDGVWDGFEQSWSPGSWSGD